MNELRAIWKGELRRALTSGRALVLLALFLLFTGLVLGAVGVAMKVVTNQADQALADAVSKGADPTLAKQQLLDKKREFLSNFTNDEAYVSAVLELPLVLLVTFKLLTWFVPLFVALMGFDQLSGEVGPKSIRYLVVRVRRSSILLGKLLAQVTALLLMLALGTLLMVGVTRAFHSDFEAVAMARWAGKLFVALSLLGASWAALTALFSALFRTPGVSLVVNIMAILALAFVSSLGGWFRFPGEEARGVLDTLARSESWAAYLRYASVWHFGQSLIHPDWRQLGAAALAHAGWAASFLGVAQVTLAERDL